MTAASPELGQDVRAVARQAAVFATLAGVLNVVIAIASPEILRLPASMGPALLATAVVIVALLRLPWETWPAERLLALLVLACGPMTALSIWNTGGAESPMLLACFWVPIMVAPVCTLRQSVGTIALYETIAILAVATDAQGERLSVAMIAFAGTVCVLTVNLVRGTARRRRALEAELREQAETDPLTGLLNRRAFATVLEREARLAADGGRFAICCLDVDGLKQLNDSHGHAAGDDALRCVAAAVQRRVRPGDHVARVGGDELVAILRDAGAGAAAALERRLSMPVRAERGSVSLTVGWAVFPDDASDPHELLELADGRLVQLKAERGTGRGEPSDSLFSSAFR